MKKVFTRNLNQRYTLNTRENGAHAGCTAFRVVHPALKSCTQGSGCTLISNTSTDGGVHGYYRGVQTSK